MDLPDPIPSAELPAALTEIESTSREWLAISAALRIVEAESKDVRAGSLMTAFDYDLARRWTRCPQCDRLLATDQYCRVRVSFGTRAAGARFTADNSEGDLST